MLFLIFDITPDYFSLRGTDRERPIPFLPRKLFQANLLVNPSRRGAFYLANDIRHTIGCAQSDQNVNVIIDPANDLRKSA